MPRDFPFIFNGFRPSLCPKRNSPFAGEVCVVAKPKGVAGNGVQVVRAATDNMPLYAPYSWAIVDSYTDRAISGASLIQPVISSN